MNIALVKYSENFISMGRGSVKSLDKACFKRKLRPKLKVLSDM